ncbi:MAG: hypothetical protein ACK50Q_14615 [Labrys sp. (in: a-proteobacteria)]|jgi:hypothetical protein
MRSDQVKPGDLATRHAARRSRGKMMGGFRRDTFVLPREEARAAARQQFERFPRAAYMTEIEFWEELSDGRIRFTMRRLPTSD